jgi:Protein of unknown function (DUF1566)
MKRPSLLMLVALVSVVGMLWVSNVAAQPTQALPPQLYQQLQQIQQSLKALQSAVDQIPPAWSKILPAASRFVLVMNGEAVLDRETGLVWERSPSAGTIHKTWSLALEWCGNLNVGDRYGWRLPAVQELASLIDPSVAAGSTLPDLPTGHPFQNVQLTYWSANTHAEFSTWARVVSLKNGEYVVSNGDKIGLGYVWCVRCGQGTDSQ